MEKTMIPFLTPDLALTLDVLGQAYSTRPSKIMGFLSEGRAFMFDIKVRKMAQKEKDRIDKESETVTGKYKAKQKNWPEWAKKVVRGQ